jgi:hypothetical protein
VFLSFAFLDIIWHSLDLDECIAYDRATIISVTIIIMLCNINIIFIILVVPQYSTVPGTGVGIESLQLQKKTLCRYLFD